MSGFKVKTISYTDAVREDVESVWVINTTHLIAGANQRRGNVLLSYTPDGGENQVLPILDTWLPVDLLSVMTLADVRRSSAQLRSMENAKLITFVSESEARRILANEKAGAENERVRSLQKGYRNALGGTRALDDKGEIDLFGGPGGLSANTETAESLFDEISALSNEINADPGGEYERALVEFLCKADLDATRTLATAILNPDNPATVFIDAALAARDKGEDVTDMTFSAYRKEFAAQVAALPPM